MVQRIIILQYNFIVIVFIYLFNLKSYYEYTTFPFFHNKTMVNFQDGSKIHYIAIYLDCVLALAISAS